MTAAPYEFSDAQSYSTKCFPARTSFHRRKEGVGHWLVALRQAEGQKHRNVHRRAKEILRKREPDRGAFTPRGRTLDGPFLLRLHCVDKPSELCSIEVSEQKLNSVKPEDLKVFHNVAYINASINSLSLESFSSFVSLRELNLSLNGLCEMTFQASDFPHLEVLDLSYNSLSADGIVSIGQLPHLKVLHLTGNQLHHLPSNLGFSNHDASHLPAQEDAQFEALEVLVLEDNRLSSGVFNCLKNLKRLKRLNLEGNHISEIPYLQLMGSSKHSQTFIEEQVEEEGLASNKPNPDEHVKRITQQNWEEYWKRSSFPLPALQFLNLAGNKIAEEEALMAAALFPMIQEIDIHSNPLTVQRSGDPPLLTHYLQEGLGIAIKRKKTQKVVKPPLKMDERMPKVSKKSLLMNPPRSAQAEKSETTVKRTPEFEGTKDRADTFQENTEEFFLTQATDFPEYNFKLEVEEEISAQYKKKNGDIPGKFTHDEILMDANSNPDVLSSIGIQTAVRMLEHTLRNLNVYRHSKPNLDCIQRPYKKREKKTKQLPALKPIKGRAERVDEMMKEIRGTTTTKEIPLSRALHSTGVNKQEALLLLQDMKAKYKTLHKKTMEQDWDLMWITLAEDQLLKQRRLNLKSEGGGRAKWQRLDALQSVGTVQRLLTHL